jgi:hypothetical protein
MTVRNCRNCGGAEWYTKEVAVDHLRPLGFIWWSPKFEIRICGSCGLIEWFVPERMLDRMKERFSRLTAR